MGRPSVLEVSAEKRDGEVVEARVAGTSVLVSEGDHLRIRRSLGISQPLTGRLLPRTQGLLAHALATRDIVLCDNAETHPLAMKIGKPVFKAMSAPVPDVISSDCALAGHHIAQGMANDGAAPPVLRHPLSLLRQAYGLD